MEAGSRESQVRKSLLDPKLLAGVEVKLAVINFIVGFSLVANLHVVWFIPVTLLIHMLLRKITKSDPFTRLIYLQYRQQADRYEPWPMVTQERNQRPVGFGQGMLC